MRGRILKTSNLSFFASHVAPLAPRDIFCFLVRSFSHSSRMKSIASFLLHLWLLVASPVDAQKCLSAGTSCKRVLKRSKCCKPLICHGHEDRTKTWKCATCAENKQRCKKDTVRSEQHTVAASQDVLFLLTAVHRGLLGLLRLHQRQEGTVQGQEEEERVGLPSLQGKPLQVRVRLI